MIWITGNKGMLGSAIEKLFSADSLAFLGTDTNVDITDSDQVDSFMKENDISWIINCAAYTAVDNAEQNSEDAYLLNETGPAVLAKAARKYNAKLIHFSTDYVFDGNRTTPYRENDPTAPLSVYGASKLAGEKRIAESCSNHFILRISWLFGPSGNNFVNTMIRLFHEKKELNVINDQFGTPTYTEDVAKSVLKIVKTYNTNFGIYNLTNSGDTSWYEYCSKIYEIYTKNIEVRCKKISPVCSNEYPTAAKRPMYSILSKEKLKTDTGLELPPWDDSLENYLSSYILQK